MKKYDFDQIITRKYATKWEEMGLKFGTDDLLPFWIADMDFRSADPIIEAIRERAEEGIFGYTYRPDSYYQAAAQWLKKRHQWEIDESWIIHSPGICTSLSLIVAEFTRPGDKIIIQPPVYYPFFDIVKDMDRTLVLNPLKQENGRYCMDYDDLINKIDDDVKMLILCSPHNPVGRVWEREELQKLGEICFRHGIRVVSDEIHFDIVYRGHNHIPFASLGQKFLENSMTCISPNKTFNLAGLQSSCMIIPNKDDYERFSKTLGVLDIKRNNCFSLVATEAAYRHGEEWLEQLLEYLEGNIDFALDFFTHRIPKIKVSRPEGTFLLWLDCSGLGLNRDELGHFMLNKAKVALDYGDWFGPGGENFLRINIACPRALLNRGLERLEKALEEKA